jgi:hypothetical protein
METEKTFTGGGTATGADDSYHSLLGGASGDSLVGKYELGDSLEVRGRGAFTSPGGGPTVTLQLYAGETLLAQSGDVLLPTASGVLVFDGHVECLGGGEVRATAHALLLPDDSSMTYGISLLGDTVEVANGELAKLDVKASVGSGDADSRVSFRAASVEAIRS